LGEDGDVADSVEVAWTPDESHPQTCVACHDPHSVGTTTGVTTDSTARIYGDTPLLLAGFIAEDVANGAICMTCHNTRRGLRNDDTWVDTVAEGDTARAPHPGAQADVLMGQNAYFVAVGTPGNHALTANVEDTCVTCHMELTPPPDDLAYNQGGSNHTFFARDDICLDCHGFGAEAVQPAVQANLDELQGLIEDAILALMDELLAAGNTIDLDGLATITDISEVADVVFGETHGRQGIAVTLADSTELEMVRVTDVDILDGGESIGDLYDFADDRLAKSGWNYNLIHSDESLGGHNPTFTNAVLGASIDEMEALLAE
jgi:hypothetical protein